MKYVTAIMLLTALFMQPYSSAFGLPEGALAVLGKGRPHGIAYSPDGAIMAVGTSNGVYFYDAITYKEIGSIGEGSQITSVSFSPDGGLIAAGGHEGIRLWDAESLQEIEFVEGYSNFAFSLDGNILVLEGSGVRLWDAKELKEVALIPDAHYPFALSPDGSLLACLGEYRDARIGEADVDLWDVKSLQKVATLAGAWPQNMEFSPDGSLLAIGRSYVGVTLLDVKSLKEVVTLGGSDDIFSLYNYPGYVSFSHDGSLLACVFSGVMVSLWDLSDYQEIGISGLWDVYGISFSPDGKSLAYSGRDEYEYLVRIWDFMENLTINEIKFSDFYQSIDFSPDGKLLAWEGTDSVSLWDMNTYEELATLDEFQAESVAFSPDGDILAAVGRKGIIKLWDINSGKQVLALDGQVNNTTWFAFSPDGDILAVGGRKGIIKLWDINSGKQVLALDGQVNNITCVAFSPNGEILASGDYEGKVNLWDVASGQGISSFEGHSEGVHCIEFSPDGELLATLGYDGVKLWETRNYQELPALNVFYPSDISFNPDFSLLATCRDDMVRIWDVKTGEIIYEWRFWSISVMIHCVNFSPDGRFLAWGDNFGRIHIFDVEYQFGMGELMHPDQDRVNSVAFSPDNKLLATGSRDGTVILWDMEPYIANNDVITGIEGEGKAAISWGDIKEGQIGYPIRNALRQNYPNPFNPDTWVPFELAYESDVTLKIYDMKGCLVRQISLGKKPADSYLQRSKAIHWDGRNDSGERLASGVYFYTLQAGDYTETRKMILAE